MKIIEKIKCHRKAVLMALAICLCAGLGAFSVVSATEKQDANDTSQGVTVHVQKGNSPLTQKRINLNATISGEKKQENEQTVRGWYRMERSYGTFIRSIQLPCEVDQEQCHASFKNGVLTVSLSKTPQAQAASKSIPIKKE